MKDPIGRMILQGEVLKGWSGKNYRDRMWKSRSRKLSACLGDHEGRSHPTDDRSRGGRTPIKHKAASTTNSTGNSTRKAVSYRSVFKRRFDPYFFQFSHIYRFCEQENGFLLCRRPRLRHNNKQQVLQNMGKLHAR